MRVVLNRNSSALFSVHYSAVAAPVLGGRPTDLDGVTLTDAEKKGPEPRARRLCPSASRQRDSARPRGRLSIRIRRRAGLAVQVPGDGGV